MVANGNNDLDFNNLTVFDSQNIPGITITNYIARIMAYSRASSRNIVMALSYIDSLSNDEDCPVNFTRFSAHRLIWVSIMVASKFYEDFYLDNESWARISGLTLGEINKLERKFLNYLDFNINTKLDWFMNYLQLLLGYAVQHSIINQQTAQVILNYLFDWAVAEATEAGVN